MSRRRTVLRFVAVAVALAGVLLLALAGVLPLAVVSGVIDAEGTSEMGYVAAFLAPGGILLLMVLVVGVFFGLVTGWIGRLRGRCPVNWFCLGFYLPILALIAVVVLPADPRDDAQ